MDKNELTLSYILKSAACASFAGCTAEAATLPFDTAKVRLQLEGSDGSNSKYSGLMRTI